jgi:hypothetical protein
MAIPATHHLKDFGLLGRPEVAIARPCVFAGFSWAQHAGFSILKRTVGSLPALSAAQASGVVVA